MKLFGVLVSVMIVAVVVPAWGKTLLMMDDSGIRSASLQKLRTEVCLIFVGLATVNLHARAVMRLVVRSLDGMNVRAEEVVKP